MVPPSLFVHLIVSTAASCTCSLAIHAFELVSRTGAPKPTACRFAAQRSDDSVPWLLENTQVVPSCESANPPLTPGIGARVVASSPVATSTPKSAVRVPCPVDQYTILPSGD